MVTMLVTLTTVVMLTVPASYCGLTSLIIIHMYMYIIITFTTESTSTVIVPAAHSIWTHCSWTCVCGELVEYTCTYNWYTDYT